MSKAHFVFPEMESTWPVSLYGVAAPIAPSYLWTIGRSIDFGVYNDGHCWDLSLSSSDEVLEEVAPGDLVCVSVTLTGYAPGLHFLKGAKKKGATVAIGGPWATVRSQEIFKSNPWIDHVVAGEGETAITKILRKTLEKGAFRNPAEALTSLPRLSFSGWRTEDLQAFAHGYQRMIESGEYGPPPEHIPAFIFYQSERGCIQKPRCAFCGVRTGRRLSMRSAEQFYDDIGYLKEEFGNINNRLHLFNTSDSFTSFLDRFKGNFKRIAGVTFTVFARADEITPETAQALSCLGVTKVSVGIEVGSNESLDFMGKRTSTEMNVRAVKLLKQYGIRPYINFMYGVPNETVETLNQTIDHVLEVCEEGSAYRAKGRIVTVLPGSRWFGELAKIHPRFKKGDMINVKEVVNTWLFERTHVSFEDIDYAHQRFTAGAQDLGVTFSSETATWFG